MRRPASLPADLEARPEARRPSANEEIARNIAGEHWGERFRAAACRRLPGERDANFLLTTPDDGRFVLKVATAGEAAARSDLQIRMAEHAMRRDPSLRLPEAVPTGDGREIVEVRLAAGATHAARMTRHLPGVPLSRIRRRPDALLSAIGMLLGRLQIALAGFDHPALDGPPIPWEPRRAGEVIGRALGAIGRNEEEDYPTARSASAFASVAGPVLRALPRLLALPGVPIHCDANEDNLLLSGADPESAGPGDLALLDFGDATRGPGVVEAANGAFYAGLAAPEPLRAAATVLAGFAEVRPLSEEECAVFRVAVAARALVSFGVARMRALPSGPEAQRDGATSDPYLFVSEEGALRTLAALASEHPALSTARFRTVGGFPPTPRHRERVQQVRRAALDAAPPVPLPENVGVLDLRVANPDLDPEDPERSLRALGGGVAVGRFLEPRPPRKAPRQGIQGTTRGDQTPGDAAHSPAHPGVLPRTVHLGLDIFAPVGAPVAAPLAGEIQVADERIVVARHGRGSDSFSTVWRGLEGLPDETLAPGRVLAKGVPFGRIAAAAKPDGAPAHLHFQVFLDDPEIFEFAAAAAIPPEGAAEDLDILAALCPDPSPFFGPAAGERFSCPDPREDGSKRILAVRQRRLSTALSLAYRRPIHVVRGRGARLYDSLGRPYLDMVNNVCHVGHAHPRVVEAISRQAALLNTNTRYLHGRLADYADRLAALLPDPLEVVFLVNSGSEANELALRLARSRVGTDETLVLEGGYHGNTGGLIARSPYKLDGPGGFPSPPWARRLPTPDGFRGDFDDRDPEWAGRLIAETRRRVEDGGPAALLAEAILSCGGQIVPPPGYLGALYDAVRAKGGVVIADEVQTGLGRVGPDFWAFTAASRGDPAVPDIVTLGKPIGNGHPLGAVVATREVARSFETGMEYFNTFGGNPVSCAAGLAVLDVIEDEGLALHAERIGRGLLDGIGRLARTFPMIGQVRGRGLFLGFELVKDARSREPDPMSARRLVGRLRDFGILNSTDGPHANVIKLKPPLVFSRPGADDASFYLEALEVALGELA